VPMKIDLTKISGSKKNVWWFTPHDGQLFYIGEFDNKATTFYRQRIPGTQSDGVLIAVDSKKNYLSKDQMYIDEHTTLKQSRDLNE